MVSFWWHYLPSSSLGRTLQSWEKAFFPSFEAPPPSLSPLDTQKPDTTHTPLMAYHHDEK